MDGSCQPHCAWRLNVISASVLVVVRLPTWWAAVLSYVAPNGSSVIWYSIFNRIFLFFTERFLPIHYLPRRKVRFFFCKFNFNCFHSMIPIAFGYLGLNILRVTLYSHKYVHVDYQFNSFPALFLACIQRPCYCVIWAILRELFYHASPRPSRYVVL